MWSCGTKMTENWCSGLDKGIVVLFCTDMFVRKRHLWLFTMIDLLVRGLIPLRKESLARCSCGLIWFGTVMMSLIIQNVAAACWICCSSWRRKVWGDVAAPPVPQHASSNPFWETDNDDLPGHPGSPYDEATIGWMVHVRKWLLTSFRNETSGEDGNTMLVHVLQLSNCFPKK